MKVKIKGLVFVGFAAAILSANAMAAGENIVTSKSYTDATYQVKSSQASIGSTGGSWVALATTVDSNSTDATAPTALAVKTYVDSAAAGSNFVENEINAEHTAKAPSGQAVAAGLANKQNITAADSKFVVGNSGGTWQSVSNAVLNGTYTTQGVSSSTGAVTIDVDATATLNNADSGEADFAKIPTAGGVKAYVDSEIAAVDSARTYHSGTNISIDTTNHISADTGAIASGATTLVTGGTVYTALLDEQDKNTTDKYEVNKNGVWTDIGNAVSGDTNYIGVTANDSTGALTVSALTTAVADNATGLATAQGVYDYVQGITNGNEIPAQNPLKCTATTPCALVAINNNGTMEQHWYTMATATNSGGELADAQ